jgi:positive regulator of sigma E activity
VFAIRLRQHRSPFSPDMNHIHHNVLKLTGSHLASSLIIVGVNALIILCAFLLIDELGNNNLFFLILISGFVLASIPYYMVRKKETSRKNKTIFALSIFQKKLKSE